MTNAFLSPTGKIKQNTKKALIKLGKKKKKIAGSENPALSPGSPGSQVSSQAASPGSPHINKGLGTEAVTAMEAVSAVKAAEVAVNSDDNVLKIRPVMDGTAVNLGTRWQVSGMPWGRITVGIVAIANDPHRFDDPEGLGVSSRTYSIKMVKKPAKTETVDIMVELAMASSKEERDALMVDFDKRAIEKEKAQEQKERARGISDDVTFEVSKP